MIKLDEALYRSLQVHRQSNDVVTSEAPLLHAGLELQHRCELALSGFLLQDLWSLLATRREVRLGLKKGTCQLACQTRSNLQCVALTIASMCLKKGESWTPFEHCNSLSEISIERMFGRFRASSQSGELHCRAYWAASAAVARSELTKLQSMNKKFGAREDVTPCPALTPAEPLAEIYRDIQR